uniref:HTH CENPB-type domain-containing protein n=1 Tax=Cuerna arida TaxID=1464854 RepID=A0A1B6ERC5_9HEMI
MELKFDVLLKRLEKGENVNKIALNLNVGRSTVLGWQKKKSEIESGCLKRMCTESIKERKSIKCAEYEKVSEALYQWFRVQRDKGVPISGPILQEKALKFYEEFKEEGDSGFTASNGWLDRWKQRYGVKQLSICGEKLSADPNSVGEFKIKFQELIEKEGLTGDQIYN